MTREEQHIAVLRRLLESMDVYDSIQPTTERKKAIKAAIQALSQEPTEKPMCDRNICLNNEYSGIGCDECIVNKAEQEPCDVFDEYGNYKYPSDVELTEPNTATSMPCDDAISREDATAEFIKWQTEVAYAFGRDYLGVRIIQSAIDTIRALPPVNPQPCEDAISRQAVLDGLKGCICDEWVKTLFATMVKQLPPVTQKSGKWIVHEKPHGIRYLECPHCNTWYLNEHLIRNSYCPNCGAKMVEP